MELVEKYQNKFVWGEVDESGNSISVKYILTEHIFTISHEYAYPFDGWYVHRITSCQRVPHGDKYLTTQRIGWLINKNKESLIEKYRYMAAKQKFILSLHSALRLKVDNGKPITWEDKWFC